MDEQTSKDRRAVLEEGYDKIDKATEPAPEAIVETPAEAAPEAPAEPPSGDRVRDEKGRFVAKEGEEKPVGEPVAPEAVQAPVAAPPAPPPPPDIPPPKSWKATERELWAKVPKEARDPILRREKETLDAIGRAENAVSNWKRFEEAYRPYEHIMRMNGTTDPVQSVQNLLNTAAVLQMGNPQQQAQTVAQVMRQFNVDPGLVASYLEGQVPQQGPQQFRDPRFDQFLATLERSRADRQAREQQQLQGELSKFADSHEFFEDVRDEMADLIDAWDNAGKLNEGNLPAAIQKAYDIAVMANEDTAKAMKQREAAKSITTSQAATEKAKAAASSVKSTPALAQGKAKSLRETLEARFDELNQ